MKSYLALTGYCTVWWRFLWTPEFQNASKVPETKLPIRIWTATTSRLEQEEWNHKICKLVKICVFPTSVQCLSHNIQLIALVPDCLGPRFRVRYIRNPVYPNTRLYKTHCELFLCGTEILGLMCANSGIAESGIRLIDCTWCRNQCWSPYRSWRRSCWKGTGKSDRWPKNNFQNVAFSKKFRTIAKKLEKCKLGQCTWRPEGKATANNRRY